jgi:hypothetical protein
MLQTPTPKIIALDHTTGCCILELACGTEVFTILDTLPRQEEEGLAEQEAAA